MSTLRKLIPVLLAGLILATPGEMQAGAPPGKKKPSGAVRKWKKRRVFRQNVNDGNNGNNNEDQGPQDQNSSQANGQEQSNNPPGPGKAKPARRPTDPYAAIDRHALATPRAAERSIKSLAHYLVRPARDNRQKVRAIYRWMTDRVAYNTAGYFAKRYGDGSARAVLKTRKAVCDGYANLFQALCKRAHVPVVKVRGWGKGVGYRGVLEKEPDHAWNAVQLGRRWFLVDSTWGAGWIDGQKFVKQFDDYFFLTPPDQLIFSHFPKEPRWQLLSRRLSGREFVALPRMDDLFKMGVSGGRVRQALAGGKLRELVKTYTHPGGRLIVREAPLGRRLRAGAVYRFRVEPTAYYGAIVVNNAGQRHALARKGNGFEGVVSAARGPITVEAYVRGTSRYWLLLEYMVE
jgi:hypothetical protein